MFTVFVLLTVMAGVIYLITVLFPEKVLSVQERAATAPEGAPPPGPPLGQQVDPAAIAAICTAAARAYPGLTVTQIEELHR